MASTTDMKSSSAKSLPSALSSAKSMIEADAEISRATIKAVDMPEEMQRAAVESASNALEKFNMEKDIAASIKKEFDRRYGATWHCVVGSNFGCFVTHESKHFIYFYLGASAILLFKTV